ncbi:MAG: hypothetical protein IPF98_25500 [Gemmatimonadetes bacterium]|nr:hypothetical protein [Gemmatimonadota bacterium]
MTTRDAGPDWIPNTPTARALEGAVHGVAEGAVAIEKPSPGRCREVPADPSAPGAPTCSGRKYIVADPDAPAAPLCGPKNYIIAPDTAPSSRLAPASRSEWATRFGAELAERFR